MRLNEITYTDAVPIDAYGPGFFRISGKVVEGAILVFSGGVSKWNGYDDVDVLLAAADEIDVLFVGTGTEITVLPSAFRTSLEQAGIGVEGMATPSACRTYNVLLSEGRRVALAMLPV